MEATKSQPDTRLTRCLTGVPAGLALDLACGSGRHSTWLASRGWSVTAVDIAVAPIPGVRCVRADLERHEFLIEPAAWDLIVCWMYWQADLIPEIVRGVRPGGIVALAGKTSGRFATSLEQYRSAFRGWTELAAGENEGRAYFIGQADFGAREQGPDTGSGSPL